MGMCGSVSKNLKHLMIAGIENSGKTYFLYSRLKQFISSKDIYTKPTDCKYYQ